MEDIKGEMLEEFKIKEEMNETGFEDGIKIEEDYLQESLKDVDSDIEKRIKLEQNAENNDCIEEKEILNCNDEITKDSLLSDDFIPQSESGSSSISSDVDEDSRKKYTCKRCDFKTKYKGNLKQHKNAKHFGKVDLCQFCGKKYKDRSNLNRHIRVKHLGKPRTSYSLLQTHYCIYCEFKTVRKENLRMHMNSLHTFENIFPCEICTYVGTRIDSYRKHMQAMHESKEKHYKCSRCSFKTLRRDFFEKHVEENHSELKVFPCRFCEYRATFSCNLMRHIQRKHSR